MPLVLRQAPLLFTAFAGFVALSALIARSVT